MRFSEASRVEANADGTWSADLAENWDIVGKTNGGYMQAIAARASSLAVGGRNPVSITGHFTRPGQTGPVSVDTEVVRNGRRFSVVRARVIQSDEIILETLGSFQEPAATRDEILLSDVAPPDIPGPDQCPRVRSAEGASFPPPLMEHLDVRVDPVLAGALTGSPPGQALIEGWFRLLNDEPLDPFALILAADAFPPTAFAAALPLGWTPTLDLSVHIRFPNPRGWLRCQLRSHFISGGFIEEDGLFWDEDNRLVAQSRQLALVSTAPG